MHVMLTNLLDNSVNVKRERTSVASRLSSYPCDSAKGYFACCCGFCSFCKSTHQTINQYIIAGAYTPRVDKQNKRFPSCLSLFFVLDPYFLKSLQVNACNGLFGKIKMKFD